MTDFAVIVPTRGDRPQFFEFCKHQLDRQTIQPKARYYIAYEPENNEMDLVRRIKSGIELAKRDGVDLIFCFEDDDSYPRDYFQRYLPRFKQANFIGDSMTYYYNVVTKRWSDFRHSGRSSLFTTAFRVSALEGFKWPDDNARFLDLSLWKFAKRKAFVNSGAIGIKHGTGLVGGKGHKMRLNYSDPEMKWLKSKVEDYQFQFYANFNTSSK